MVSFCRHAKAVYEQNARKKIMSQESEQIPVAAVSAVAKERKIILNSIVSRSMRSEVTPSPTATAAEPVNSSSVSHGVVLPKQARRVLPEHEGRYKITLPSGTTKRSQEILAKKAMCKLFSFSRIIFADLFHTSHSQCIQTKTRRKEFSIDCKCLKLRWI